MVIAAIATEVTSLAIGFTGTVMVGVVLYLPTADLMPVAPRAVT